eukprot:4960138-Prymnesium_polylepis.1
MALQESDLVRRETLLPGLLSGKRARTGSKEGHVHLVTGDGRMPLSRCHLRPRVPTAPPSRRASRKDRPLGRCCCSVCMSCFAARATRTQTNRTRPAAYLLALDIRGIVAASAWVPARGPAKEDCVKDTVRCSRCPAMEREVGCSNTTVGDKWTPVRVRSWPASSVAASESTPASMSGVSAVTTDAEVPASSRTTRSTALSMCARRCVGASASSVCTPPAPCVVLEVSTAVACKAEACSSPNRGSDASARSCSNSSTFEACVSCTLSPAPAHAARCLLRHAAYSSRETPDSPATATRRPSRANAAAPIPAS